MPYCFSRWSIEFQGCMGNIIDDLNSILSKITRPVVAINPPQIYLVYSSPTGTSCIVQEPEIQGTMYGPHIQTVVRDGDCALWCQCPGLDEYVIHGTRTRAACIWYCDDGNTRWKISRISCAAEKISRFQSILVNIECSIVVSDWLAVQLPTNQNIGQV